MYGQHGHIYSVTPWVGAEKNIFSLNKIMETNIWIGLNFYQFFGGKWKTVKKRPIADWQGLRGRRQQYGEYRNPIHRSKLFQNIKFNPRQRYVPGYFVNIV